MNKYELLYIVGTQYTDPEVEGIQKQIVALLEKSGATISRNENLGKIRLAYIIKKVRHGSYILVHFDAEGTVLKELNRQLGLTEEVLRHTLLERAPGAEAKKFEITAYVAPLSEEAKRPDAKPVTASSAAHREKVASIEESTATPLVAADVEMSVEELDKKLDEILDAGMTEAV